MPKEARVRELFTRVKQTIYEPYYGSTHYRDPHLDSLFMEVQAETNPQERVRKGWGIVEAIIARRDLMAAGDALMDLPFRIGDELNTIESLAEIISRNNISSDDVATLDHWLSYVLSQKDEDFRHGTPIKGVTKRFFRFENQVQSVLAHFRRPDDYPTVYSLIERVEASKKQGK